MSDVTEIKNRILSLVPLEKLIGETVSLKKRGSQLSGCCPFHEEKTPSFYIYSDNYHCFGCGAHGDAISFVREKLGMGFIETLKYLAQKYGIDASGLDERRKSHGAQKSEKRLIELMNTAHAYFTQKLWSPEGMQCLDYFKERGFSENFIKERGLGFAPNDPVQLYKMLTAKGFTFSEIEKCSLANRYDNGKTVNFFINRAMVPVRDTSGRLIAFGGRTLDAAPNKYKNSKYDKSSVLYGLYEGRPHIRKRGRAIVCEGYMDTLQLWNYGILEATACQGTALTPFHMRLLSLATKKVYLMFDGDTAGQQASLKALSHSLEYPEVDFRVCVLPAGEDPDSYVRIHGQEGVEKLLSGSVSLVDFAISEKLKTAHTTALPSLITGDFLPWISKIKDSFQRELLVNKLGELSGFPKNRLRDRLSLIMGERKPHSTPSAAASHHTQNEVTPLTPTQNELFGHLWFASGDDGVSPEKIAETLIQDFHLDPVWEDAFETVLTLIGSGKCPAKEEPSHHPALVHPAVFKTLDQLAQKSRAFEVESRQNAIQKIMVHLKKQNLQKAISDLKAELAGSQLDGGDDWKKIATSISELQRELKSIL